MIRPINVRIALPSATWALLFAASIAGTASADTLLAIDGFEGRFGPWNGTDLASDPVHGGTGALKWDVGEKPTLDSVPYVKDWSKFDEFVFWAHLDEPVDFKIPLVFPAEGGYYIIDWQLDWEGWKEHRIKLADCREAYEPIGWHAIKAIGFRAQGYG
ncbi:MAG TPA: hypothetical protein QGH10_15420, partial [Armatimonadota bacterium]|nr:hypothetical protein [Armatimonadota bacterium]